MLTYDAHKAPTPTEWLKLSNEDRLQAVHDFHERAGLEEFNMQSHCACHVMVEDQLANNVPYVVEAFTRLNTAGLIRHEVVHAIGWVMVSILWEQSRGQHQSPGSFTAEYQKRLGELTVEMWRSQTSRSSRV